MAERPERAHREELFRATTTATATATAATPGSTASANGMRLLRPPRFLSLAPSRELQRVEDAPGIRA